MLQLLDSQFEGSQAPRLPPLLEFLTATSPSKFLASPVCIFKFINSIFKACQF